MFYRARSVIGVTRNVTDVTNDCHALQEMEWCTHPIAEQYSTTIVYTSRATNHSSHFKFSVSVETQVPSQPDALLLSPA